MQERAIEKAGRKRAREHARQEERVRLKYEQGVQRDRQRLQRLQEKQELEVQRVWQKVRGRQDEQCIKRERHKLRARQKMMPTTMEWSPVVAVKEEQNYVKLIYTVA